MVMDLRVPPLQENNVGSVNVVVTCPDEAVSGDLRLVCISGNNSAGNSAYLTPEGWTKITNRTFNTRGVTIFAKRHAPADPSSQNFPMPSAGAATVLQFVFIGESIIDSSEWIIGTDWTRPASNTELRAPSMTAPRGSTVLSFLSEASTSGEIVSTLDTLAGATLLAYAGEVSGHINTWVVATERFLESGPSGDTTMSTAAPSGNGYGVQIAFPDPVVVTPPEDSGKIRHILCPHFTESSIRVGVSSFDPSEVVKITDGSITKTVAVDSETRWGSVTFDNLTPGTSYSYSVLVNDVLQTDVSAVYTTMDQGPTNFKFLAGSCQFTASNHPIFEVMMGEGASFLAHMGDLHYANATTRDGWREAVDYSLEASRMKDMLEVLPMDWQWDNHDRIIIDTLNLGTTDPETVTSYRHLSGTTGWPVENSNCRTWVQGRVRFVSTDFWTNRQDPDLVAEPRTMLGSDQKAWLIDVLASAKEPLIVWFSQWTNQNNANGRWNSFSAETTELEALVSSLPGLRDRMIMIGGDSHSLQADSGMRKGVTHRFHGVPSLNVSGFNRSSDVGSGTPIPWDIADRSIKGNPGVDPEAMWGAYSRVTIEDDGGTINFLWEAVRVRDDSVVDILATYSRTFSTIYIGGEIAIPMYYDTVEGRRKPFVIETK